MTKNRLSAAQAAELLGISVTILRRQARNGVVPAKKRVSAGFSFFHKGGLRRWLKKGGPR